MRFRPSTVVLLVIFAASSLAALEVWAVFVVPLLLAMLAGIHLWRTGDKAGPATFFVGVFIAIVLVYEVLSAWLGVRWPPTYSGRCQGNLRNVALGLIVYEDAWRCFPPAYARGPGGKPWHSWRVLLLPFVEAEPCYKQYDFHEPWDGPKNRQLAEKMPDRYRCPSVPYADGKPTLMTSYVAVTGPGTMWPGSESRTLRGLGEDRGKTLLLVEIADSDIHWMEPRDLRLDELLRDESAANQLRSNHKVYPGYFFRPEDGVQIAMADASVHLLPGRFSKEGLKALATIGGAETMSLQDALVRDSIWRRLHWPRVVGMTFFVLSFILLAWQAFRQPRSTRKPTPGPDADQKADG
jgi:hypothetical protein